MPLHYFTGKNDMYKAIANLQRWTPNIKPVVKSLLHNRS